MTVAVSIDNKTTDDTTKTIPLTMTTIEATGPSKNRGLEELQDKCLSSSVFSYPLFFSAELVCVSLTLHNYLLS